MRWLTLLVVVAALAGCGGDDGDSSSSTPCRLGRRVAQGRVHELRQAVRRAKVDSRSPARTSSPRRSARASSPTSSPRPTPSCPTQLYRRRAASRSRPVVRRPTGSCSRCRPTATITSLADLASPASKLAIGAETCRSAPTRARCSTSCRPRESKAILANVRSEEPDVGGHRRQAHPGRRRRRLRLRHRRPGGRRQAARRSSCPPSLQPQVAYGAAVVKGAKHPEQAAAFVAGLLHGDGRAGARRAGFVRAARQ